MTQEQAALHEKFLKGISLKMLWGGAMGIVTVVSSFWIGYGQLKDSIKDIRVQDKEELTAAVNAFRKSRDSAEHANEIAHKDIWHALDKKADKINSTSFLIERRNARTGKLSLIPVR